MAESLREAPFVVNEHPPTAYQMNAHDTTDDDFGGGTCRINAGTESTTKACPWDTLCATQPQI